MSEREILLKKIGACKFAITDIDIFLDTHPGDTEMLARRNQYEEELKPLVRQYEAQYGALTKGENRTNTWSWVKDPWPWDREA